MTATTQALATGLAHEVVLTMGVGDPDHASAHVAQEHRRLLRERLLLAIADYLREQETPTEDASEKWIHSRHIAIASRPPGGG